MVSPNQGQSGWFEVLPSVDAARALRGDRTADWLVIGGGCCGLAVAHRLGELCPDDVVVVLESDRVGEGASGRNSGFIINAHLHGIETREDQLRGQFRLWDAGVNWLRDTVRDYQIQCDWSEWGRLYVAVGPQGRAHLATLAERFGALGFDLQQLDASAVEAATGSNFYSAGVRMPHSALVQPAALMRGLAEHLPANVALFESTAANSLTRRRGAWQAVTPDGVVTARRVILAAGAHTPALGFLKHRIAPLMLYASLTQVLSDSERAMFGQVTEFGLLPTSANGSTVRLTRDGRILMRNTTRYAGRHLSDGIQESSSAHGAAIVARWPALGRVKIEHTWGGVMAVTRNGGSLFGQVGDDAYAVMTSDVSPVSRGVTAGRLLVEHILGHQSELLSAQLALAKATLVPPEPFLGWVARRRLAQMEMTEAEEQ